MILKQSYTSLLVLSFSRFFFFLPDSEYAVIISNILECVPCENKLKKLVLLNLEKKRFQVGLNRFPPKGTGRMDPGSI